VLAQLKAIKDPHWGLKACRSCGLAFSSTSNISMEAEYRVFNDDEESKGNIRTGPGHSLLSCASMNLSTKPIKPKLDTNDRAFYNEIVRKIWEILEILYEGDANKKVGDSAVEKAYFAVMVQSLQKLGKIPMPKSKSRSLYLRKRYANKNRIVTYSLMVALAEVPGNRFTVHDINLVMQNPVPKYLVTRFRDKMNLYMEQYPHLLK